MAKAAGNPFPDTSVADPPPGFWERVLPEALLAALDKLPRRFDAIIVDEGQDFLDSWWDPLMLSLSDLKGGIVYVFHDDNQQDLPPRQRVPGAARSRSPCTGQPAERPAGFMPSAAAVLPRGAAHARARPRGPASWSASCVRRRRRPSSARGQPRPPPTRA